MRSFRSCSFVMLFLLFPLLGDGRASAQPMELAADLAPGPRGGEGSAPHGFQAQGQRATFQAAGGLWVTDGTPQGTRPLLGAADAAAGGTARITARDGETIYWLQSNPSSAPALWRANLGAARAAVQMARDLSFEPPFATKDMVFVGDSLYFGAFSDDTLGVWRLRRNRRSADLVLAGPRRFTGFGPELEELAGQVLFLASDGVGTGGLWATDGSPQGTRRLASFADSGEAPRALTRAGDRVFFLAARAAGVELWVSDGTADGTFSVTDFSRPGTFRGGDNWLHPEGDEVYFLAFTPRFGEELWVSDGSSEGTRPVTDLPFPSPFPLVAREEGFQWLDGQILFAAREDFSEPFRLWRTDGTAAGTARVTAGEGPPAMSNAEVELFAQGERVYLLDTFTDPERRRLWTSDGTAAGTFPVDPLCDGACAGDVEGVAALPRELVFIDGGEGGRRQLFRTDGSRSGTLRLFTAGGEGGEPFALGPDWIARPGGYYVLGAEEVTHGAEPWTFEPSRPARLLLDIAGDGPGSFPGSSPGAFQEFRDRLVFLAAATASGTRRQRLMALDPGTAMPRVLVEDPPWADGGDEPREIRIRGDLIFLLSVVGNEIWRSDGTAQGSFQVWPGAPAIPRLFELGGDSLLFVPREPGRCELWSTDGGAGGAAKVADLSAEPCTVGPGGEAGGALYFVVESPPGSRRETLYRSDGTAAGTAVLASLDPAIFPPSVNPRFTTFGDGVLFLWAGGLWRSEGTAASTELLASVPCCAATSPMVELGGALYFQIGGASSGARFWRTDGTAEGTEVLRIFPPHRGALVDDPPLVRLEDRLYLTFDTAREGRELWASDGTAANTRLVKDLFPGDQGSHPRDLKAAAGALYFTAADPFGGRELWVLESPGRSPRRLRDLNPGAASGARGPLAVFDGSLWLGGTDGLRGDELWSLDLSPGGTSCRPGAERLCLQGGRFAVEASWRDFQGGTGRGRAVPLTADTGYFWFFDEENVEVILKTLDGRLNNDHFWTFYGALSNVEYLLTVTDTETGAARRYFNPPRNFASVGDTLSFGPLGAGTATGAPALVEAPSSALPAVLDSYEASAVGEACVASSTRLCLQDGRFSVEARWSDFRGDSGIGQAVALTGDTGYFWFFRDSNVETVVKVLDGRPSNGSFWVFYGALSNVDYDLVVTDTRTGATKRYLNRGREFASVGDTMAFPES